MNDTKLIVIGITAGLLGLLYAFLAFRVSILRIRYRVSLGESDKPDLNQAIRAHANFVEYVPFTLILLLIASVFQANFYLILAGCVLLLLHRGLHAVGITRKKPVNPFRRNGALLTYITMIYASLLCLVYGILWLRYAL